MKENLKGMTAFSESFSLTLLFACLVLVQSAPSFACSPARRAPPTVESLNSEKPRVITSTNGLYLLKLMPSQWALKNGVIIKVREAYALAFKVTASGQFQQIWGYKNWEKKGTLAFSGGLELYLYNDGKQLVEINRVVGSASDKRAVTVYQEGKMIKTYSASDFGIKSIKADRLCGIKRWTKDIPSSDGVLLKTQTGEWSISDGQLIKQ